MAKPRDPKQMLIDLQGKEIGRLRAALEEFVEVTDYQGRRIVELERVLLLAAQKSQPERRDPV